MSLADDPLGPSRSAVDAAGAFRGLGHGTAALREQLHAMLLVLWPTQELANMAKVASLGQIHRLVDIHATIAELAGFRMTGDPRLLSGTSLTQQSTRSNVIGFAFWGQDRFAVRTSTDAMVTFGTWLGPKRLCHFNLVEDPWESAPESCAVSPAVGLLVTDNSSRRHWATASLHTARRHAEGFRLAVNALHTHAHVVWKGSWDFVQARTEPQCRTEPQMRPVGLQMTSAH